MNGFESNLCDVCNFLTFPLGQNMLGSSEGLCSAVADGVTLLCGQPEHYTQRFSECLEQGVKQLPGLVECWATEFQKQTMEEEG